MVAYTPKTVDFNDLKLVWSNLNTRACFFSMTQYYLAMRSCDVCNLDIFDFDLKNGFVNIKKQKNGVVNELYPVPKPYARLLIVWVQRMWKYIYLSGGILVPTKRGSKRFKPADFITVFYRTVRKLGLHTKYYYMTTSDGRKLCRLSGHTAKASFIQNAYSKGLSEHQIQSLSHHKSRLSTLRYLGSPMDNVPLKRISSNLLFNT